MKSVITFASFLLFLNFAFLSAQEFKTPLKVNKGQEFNYQSDMIVDIVQSMGGQEMKVASTTSSTMKFSVANVLSTGNVEILASIWDAKSTTKAPMMDTTFRFDGKVSPVYKFVLNKYGTTISKEKVDTTAVSGGAAGLNFDNNLTSVGMFCEFPEKNLTVGEKWSKTKVDSVPNMGGKMGISIKTDYTLGGIETVDGRKCQKVSYVSDIELGGTGKMQGMEIFIEGTGVQNGNFFIDPVSKVIYENKSVTELDMSLAITGPQNMTIPTSQKITSTQKLK